MRVLLCAVLALLMASPGWAADPAPLPKEIQNAKVVFIVNQGAENSILDNVYERFTAWPRWTLTTDREAADLVIVVSAQNYYLGMVNLGATTTTTATATTYGNTTVVQGTSTTAIPGVPIFSFPRYLSVIDPRTGTALLSVSCELRLSKGRTASILVNRLKERFPKSER